MKIFQIVHKYEASIPLFEAKYDVSSASFDEMIKNLIEEGFMACHILEPAFNNSKDCFYTNWNYKTLQFKWAKEHGLITTDLDAILLAQIEKVKPDVIYNTVPHRVHYSLFEKLSFKPKIVCWNANAYTINELAVDKYDALLTSSVLKYNSEDHAHLHFPSRDPLMDTIRQGEQDIDILFYGQYGQKVFDERNEALETLLRFCDKKNIKFHCALTYSPWSKPMINRKFLWKLPFLQKHFPSIKMRKECKPPIYGAEIYEYIKRSKIVFNMSGGLKEFGQFKFNMRIFETLGSGGFMLSDAGEYPPYFKEEVHFGAYDSIADLKNKIEYYLKNDIKRNEIAASGLEMMKTHYSKAAQYHNFKSIVEKIN